MDASVVVCGQVFPHAVLERINAAVRDHPQVVAGGSGAASLRLAGLARSQRQAQSSELPSGAGALGSERGLIDLPAPRRSVRFSGSSFARTSIESAFET